MFIKKHYSFADFFISYKQLIFMIMDLKFITCSGTNEYTDIPTLVKLLKDFPITEIGVQVSDVKCAYGSHRFKWIKNLVDYVNNSGALINAALHVNLKWVESLGQGIIVPELNDLLEYRDINDDFFFKRIQLNFKIGREEAPDFAKLTSLIHRSAPRRFIMSYNESNAEFIEKMYRHGCLFDCLFDGSFGQGISPTHRQPPVFTDIVQGYAGGISADNVCDVLNEIQQVWQKSPTLTGIYIDAQGKLEDENTHIDLAKARQYVQNAYEWKLDHCVS